MKINNKIILLLTLLLLTAYQLNSTTNFTTFSEVVNQKLLLELVNNQRAKGCKCGNTFYPPAKPLIWNEKLALAAYKHSKDMKTRKYFSHTSPNGASSSVRISKEGYKWTACAENIANGY